MKRLFFYCFLFLAMATGIAHASYNKSLWPQWQVNNPLSRAVISHEDWQLFLNKHVTTNEEGINLIDYSHLTLEDKNLLKRYLEKMARISISEYHRSEQLAYWLNLYNALTVQIVSKYYPIGTIEEINISPGLFSIGPWGKKVITVNNVSLSLDEIQNRIIRAIWNDQRTLYAINNGAIGAPNLRKWAYHGTNIDQALNEATFEYVNSLRGAQVIEGALVVSKMYDWFIEDFGGSKKDIITHLKQFAREPLRSQLKHINDIDSYMYNWHLNATVEGKN